MQPRRIAREIALLTVSQVLRSPEPLLDEELSNLTLKAIHTLTTEVQESLENAAAELQRANERLLSSETRTNDLNTAKAMLKEAIDLASKAINRVGKCHDLPEVVQLANQQEVRDYTLTILKTIHQHNQAIEATLSAALEGWTLDRIVKIDQDILRIAVAEIQYLELSERVAINEAVELSKRYSDEDGHRFINGVLRRVVDKNRVKPS
jgi:N utilization substance protein B